MRFIYSNSIEAGTVQWMQMVIDKVKEDKSGPVEIVLTSDGGDASAIEMLTTQTKELEAIADVTITAMGQVSSAAADWFMSFKNRKMTNGSYLLLHCSKFCFEDDSPDFIIDAINRTARDDKKWFEDLWTKFSIPKKEMRKQERILRANGDIIIHSTEAYEWGLANV